MDQPKSSEYVSPLPRDRQSLASRARGVPGGRPADDRVGGVPGVLREFMNPEVNALYHVMLMSRSLAQAVVETLPKERGDELSRRIELRDAVAQEPNGLYTELMRCRSSSLMLAACAVSRRD
jgi:hypothetical protein